MRGFLTDLRLSRRLRKETAQKLKEDALWRYLIAYFEMKRAFFRLILEELDSERSYAGKRARIIELCESGLYLSPLKKADRKTFAIAEGEDFPK